MSLTSKFASEIYGARKALGFTQRQVADAVSIAPRSLQYMESGVWLPKSETMWRLMIVLHLSADLFCQEVGVNVPVSANERAIAHSGWT